VNKLAMTLGDVADHFGCEVWQVRRLYERHLLPPAARIGMYRIVDPDDLPKVEAALREAGYLKGARRGADR
jgi:DNA-binding transcriptional MerR regulator